MLKRLKDAERDGDRIYGVIAGWGVNQDGKTNGITAPNPESQARLEEEVYEKYGIDPGEIQLVEAHGTGTKLGDPIEVEGLKGAFGKYTQEVGYCALGSVKSNIGHCLMAAGVAGFIKVMKAMEHGQLPPTIEYERLNEHIELEGSPFYVNERLREWKAGGKGKRQGAISSFGFSGTNAHVVVGEYGGEKRKGAGEVRGKVIVPLSARTVEQLKEKAKELAEFVGERGRGIDLGSMAYTLQVGREGMEERLGLVVSSVEELQEKLECYLQGQVEVRDLYQGQVKRNRESVSLLSQNEEIREALVKQWLEKGKLGKVVELWVKGLEVEWGKLWGEEKPQRISLPVYPFARDRYWIEAGAGGAQAAERGTGRVLHPLVQRNTSDLAEQRYSSVFTGEEFFLAEHLVRLDGKTDRKVLPGVTYLEMVRAAIEQAAPALLESAVLELHNTVWAQPIVVDESREVHVSLAATENGQIEYEVYSADGEHEVVHCQGRAVISPETDPEFLNIESLSGQMRQGQLDPQVMYATIAQNSVRPGPSLQGVTAIHRGVDQLLASVNLPVVVEDTWEDYGLHPSLMDSMLQAAAALTSTCGGGEIEPRLPFAVESVKILGPLDRKVIVWVRYSPGSRGADKVVKLDIDVCDLSGKICLNFRGVSSRPIATTSQPDAGKLLLMPSWCALEPGGVSCETSEPAEHWVVLCELGEHYGSELRNEIRQLSSASIRVVKFQQDSPDLSCRYESYALLLLAKVQEILRRKPAGETLIQLVTPSQGQGALMAGLSGLLRTAQREQPRLIWQTIGIDRAESPGSVANRILEEWPLRTLGVVRYENGRRQALRFVETPRAIEERKEGREFRPGGTYLITGGAGGLGLVFAREIAMQAHGVRIVLAGRSPLGEAKLDQLDEIRLSGATVEYRQADVGERDEVERLVEEIEGQFGTLNGVIHAAGVLQDSLLINKTKDEAKSVLRAKVAGLLHLDEATRNMPVDFFVLFSSVASVMGNVGQADYAAANAFMDAFSSYRNTLVTEGLRSGRTTSINWPLWRDGGMRLHGAGLAQMERQGLRTLTMADGIGAFYDACATRQSQVVVLAGSVPDWRERLQDAPPIETAGSSFGAGRKNGAEPDLLLEKIETIFAETISKLLGIRIQDVDAHTDLREFGLDSISSTECCNLLNERYGLELAPTIFFEHSTIHSLAEYVIKEYGSWLAKTFAMASVKSSVEQALVRSQQIQAESKDRLLRRKKNRARSETPAKAAADMALRDEPIAIIGMSACFPQARDIDAFWQNLREGRDSITEVPKDRWDWRELFGDPMRERNKTNIKWGGFVDGVAEFDPLFFGISPGEAEWMEPQQRLMMTHTWSAIEDAGYAPRSLAGSRTAIFVGAMNSGYEELIGSGKVSIEGYTSTGMAPSMGPNRISFLLDLTGPSEPIETACSSSLVAVHRGVQALRSGQAELAIVGGVNTILTPATHISFSKAGMLSEDGRCKTFSANANGYVRGEGVGIILLKRLCDAERDGDHIYALIRGSAENHGGRANSLTAPNPKAQADVLKAAYRDAGVDAKTVGYIEAHGTGTRLGDPVEINALKSAFEELTAENQERKARSVRCGLGSVKTNVGHLELAAGVVGLIKVVLQMQNKTLVKSLHCDELNPYIQLEGTPFHIVQEQEAWEAPVDTNGSELPRRAGVSSFGFGGVNAHVVLEEYKPAAASTCGNGRLTRQSALIVLSAKSSEQLTQQARNLADTIDRQRLQDSDLESLAYTLQVGRQALEQRLAFGATSVQDLRSKLQRFVNGENGIEDLYRGEMQRAKIAQDLFRTDDELQEAIGKWIERGKYGKLMELWVRGFAVDWLKLYGETMPRRMSLPTYPFERNRYWLPVGKAHAGTNAAGSQDSPSEHLATIHPLLHQNTSDLTGPRFSSTFNGDEFFLRDHLVQGRRVMPGVAYLEMARAAVERIANHPESGCVDLRNITWLRPILADGSQQVSIDLAQDESGLINYEVYTGQGDQRHTHCEGQAVLRSRPIPQQFDTQQLRLRMCEGKIDGSEIYETLSAMGLGYGPAHRGIVRIDLGRWELLAQLHLPMVVSETLKDCVLHPSLMDAALQASVGLMVRTGESVVSPIVPFALSSVSILSPCQEEMLAWVRYSAGAADARGHTVDIDLCDLKGTVCIQIRGLVARPLPSERTLCDVTLPDSEIEAPERSFDQEFYEQLIADLLSGELTVADAAALG
jgi:polyketide synthase PksN